MAVILPFLRSAGSGDWSPAERARLARLGERLAPEAGVDVLFGTTDSGEPWCVVTDPEGEVLIHVARINGRFVVHDAAADVLEEGAELWSLLLQVLRTPEPAPAPAEIFAFPLQSRQAQTLVALITAAALLTEAGAIASEADRLEHADRGDRPEETVALDLGGPTQTGSGQNQPRRPEAAAEPLPSAQPASAQTAVVPEAASSANDAPVSQNAAPIETAEADLEISAPPPRSPSPEPQASEQARPVLAGTPGDDRLSGTAAAETLLGGAGDDTLDGGGAPDGQADLLRGGAGSDTLILARTVIAEGGAGADRFVLPSEGGDAGVLLDFRAWEGDRLESAQGEPITVLATHPVEDVLFRFRDTDEVIRADPVLGVQLSLDTDGDGAVDIHVLIATTSPCLDPPSESSEVDPNSGASAVSIISSNTSLSGGCTPLAGDGAFTAVGQLRPSQVGAHTCLEMDVDAGAVNGPAGLRTVDPAADAWLL